MKNNDQNIQVLLVDDEVDIVELLSEELKENGFNVQSALTADKAVEILEHFSPDIILCDYQMPRKNGLHVLEQAQVKFGKDHSFLFYLVTGQSNMTEEEALRIGVHQCVAKPFDIYKLIETIQKDFKEKES